MLQALLDRGFRDRCVGGRAAVAVAADGQLARWLTERDVPHLVASMPAPSRTRPFATAAAVLRLALWARRRNAVLIHCNEHDVYPFGRLVARLLGVPVVCHVRFIIGRGFAEWAFGGRRRPDALVWNSRSQREACRDAVDGVVPENRQHLVHLAIDADQFAGRPGDRERLRQEWGVAEGEVVVGMASHFEPRKRIEDFIELIGRLNRRGLPVRGVYAGTSSAAFPEYADEVRRRHDSAGLGDRLSALGKVSVEPFYQAIDLYVSASEMETFGNSVCEAMAASKPVVAYEGGSVAEVVGEVGAVVANRDLDALIEAAARYVADADLRARDGRAGRERVLENFTPAKVAERFRAVHESVLRPGTPAGASGGATS